METQPQPAAIVAAAYPKYYRLAGLCLKRESDTTTVEVLVPDPGKTLPFGCIPTVYPSKERLDEKIRTMQPVEQDQYESYLATTFQFAAKNRVRLNDFRQRQFDKNNPRPTPPAPQPTSIIQPTKTA